MFWNEASRTNPTQIQPNNQITHLSSEIEESVFVYFCWCWNFRWFMSGRDESDYYIHILHKHDVLLVLQWQTAFIPIDSPDNKSQLIPHHPRNFFPLRKSASLKQARDLSVAKQYDRPAHLSDRMPKGVSVVWEESHIKVPLAHTWPQSHVWVILDFADYKSCHPTCNASVAMAASV